jgi:tetratricopeptide (TPR) repeat protein
MKKLTISAFVLLFAILFSCTHKKNQNIAVSTEDVRNQPNIQIEKLLKSNNMDTIDLAIDRIDSALLNPTNTKSGYYFYQRGFALMKVGKLKRSILDLKKAKQLNYSPKLCDRLIELNESLQQATSGYNSKH